MHPRGNNPLQDIFTFLICEEISDIKSDRIAEGIGKYYDNKNVPDDLRHNLILSLKNGFLTYHKEDGAIEPCPIWKNVARTPAFYTGDTTSSYIKVFCTLIYIYLPMVTVFKPELTKYLKQEKLTRC